MSLHYFNKTFSKEKILSNFTFKVFKNNHRIKPKDKRKILFIGCFSEFGCETIGVAYCIPRLLKHNPGAYVIAVGWQGREFLYRHLVDEYWEINDSHMWLRDYTRAFHNISQNLKNLEDKLCDYGKVITSQMLGKQAVCNYCATCGKYWHEWRRKQKCCIACGSTVIVRSIFSDIDYYKRTALKPPDPSAKIKIWAENKIPSNAVGIFARGRSTYGRNLQPNFYIELIHLLRNKGFNPVWFGEKQSTQECPIKDIPNFRNIVDLEKVIALVSCCKFTIQYWTASTRLAALANTPYLLFESPEQVYISSSTMLGAQEGLRLDLTTYTDRKIVVSHFKNIYEDNNAGLNLTNQAIDEFLSEDYSDIIGLVENKLFVNKIRSEHFKRNFYE